MCVAPRSQRGGGRCMGKGSGLVLRVVEGLDQKDDRYRAGWVGLLLADHLDPDRTLARAGLVEVCEIDAPEVA